MIIEAENFQAKIIIRSKYSTVLNHTTMALNVREVFWNFHYQETSVQDAPLFYIDEHALRNILYVCLSIPMKSAGGKMEVH